MTHTLHILGLPHTQINKEYLTCAYTQKIFKFAQMMTSLGNEVVLYGGEHTEAPCTRSHAVFTDAEQFAWFGSNDQNDLFSKITWDANDLWWKTINDRAIDLIKQNGKKGDFICIIAGTAQKPVGDAFPQMISNEWGIGYEGIYSDFCCFESSAWMHYMYGKKRFQDGRWYDIVIPNSFDPEDFYVSPEKGDYVLFIGRLVKRKGPDIAALIAEKAGLKIKIAGPGATSVTPGNIVAPEVTISGSHVEYVGPVGVEERAKLMSEARAVITPTLYLEPFGGVAVEAMMSGTPVLASDWGAFRETVKPDLSGYRFRTLQEGVDLIQKSFDLDPKTIRNYAESNYSIDVIRNDYQHWYDNLSELYGNGWYTLRSK